MTSKKRRQRGSRTHGGGTHKNRRGAGNKGGRGRAGRDKHEHHNYDPLGKSGFTPVDPRKTEKINIKKIDEDIYEIEIGVKSVDDVDGITIVEGPEMRTDGGLVAESNTFSQTEPAGNSGDHTMKKYYVNLPEYAEEYEKVDQVKLLDGGQMHHPFSVTLDDCSKSGKKTITNNGERVYYKLDSAGFQKATKPEQVISMRYFKNPDDNNRSGDERLEEYLDQVESGESLEFHEFDDVIELGQSQDPELAYKVMIHHADNVEPADAVEVINLLRSREFAEEFGFESSIFQDKVDSYFGELEATDDELGILRIGMSERYTVDDVLDGLDRIHDRFHTDQYEGRPDLRSQRIEEEEQMYLLTVDGIVDWI